MTTRRAIKDLEDQAAALMLQLQDLRGIPGTQRAYARLQLAHATRSLGLARNALEGHIPQKSPIDPDKERAAAAISERAGITHLEEGHDPHHHQL